jgi:hypothetical protein
MGDSLGGKVKLNLRAFGPPRAAHAEGITPEEIDAGRRLGIRRQADLLTAPDEAQDSIPVRLSYN